MNYTKGEWKIRDNDIILTGSGACVATVNDGWPKEEIKYHAHLISAAPKMYEALKLYQKHQEGTRGHYCWECAEAINKALAQAEGRE